MEGNMPPGGAGGGGDTQFDRGAHIPHSHQQSDGIISDVRYSLLNGLQEYGWGVLLLCVLLYFAYNKLSNNLNTPSSARSPPSTSARAARGNRGNAASEDPDRILDQQERIAVARARMQAQLDENVEKEKVKIREREEQAREKKIQEWDNLQSGKGYYSKVKNTSNNVDSSETTVEKTTTEKAPQNRPPLAKRDYNPLMGDSSGASCSWRPAGRRSGGG